MSASEDDIKRARKLQRCECPRRYCWWWSTATFDWDVATKDGCDITFDHPDLTKCSRAVPEATTDLFEAMEENLEADGMPSDYFDIKQNDAEK